MRRDYEEAQKDKQILPVLQKEDGAESERAEQRKGESVKAGRESANFA